jgi:hypothetical protein
MNQLLEKKEDELRVEFLDFPGLLFPGPQRVLGNHRQQHQSVSNGVWHGDIVPFTVTSKTLHLLTV